MERVFRSKQQRAGGQGRPPTAYKLETAGLIVIAILILALTVLRYWHNINWRGR